MPEKKQTPEGTYDILQWNMIHGKDASAPLQPLLTILDTIIAHDTFKSGFDIILRNLDNPPTNDLQNFLGYCLAWARSVEGHHDIEGHSTDFTV